MTELTTDRSTTERAQGNISFVIIFSLALFSTHYMKARETLSMDNSWDVAMAELSKHPLTQNFAAMTTAAVIDRAAGVE